MYSHKGVPNRLRVDAYREGLARAGFIIDTLEPTALADSEVMRAIRPRLAKPFRGVSDEDLRWLGFWVICRKRAR